jgi:hypothetical protein
MSHGNFMNGNSESRKCVAYGDHLTYENRSDAAQRLAARGWAVAEWAVDNREALARPLPERPGAVRALARGVVLGLPVVVPDHLDLRSRAELMKYGATALSLGVDVHTLTGGPALAERGCTDEMDFALLTILREIAALRDTVLAVVADAASEPAAVAWSAPGGGAQPPAPPAATANESTADEGGNGEGQGAAVVQELRPYVARYWRYVDIYRDIWKMAPPPLPEQSQPWPQRRLAIGALARNLSTSSWCDWEIARLLNEAGIRTPQCCSWSPQMVNYYRRTYGRRAA